MKKNNLLLEINRISELMGSKIFLNEQLGPALVKIITKFADDASSKGWKIAKAVESELEALSRAVDEQEALKLIAKISNKSPEFAEQIIPVVMKSLSQEVKNEISRITNLAKKELDSGKTLDEVNTIIDKETKSIKSEFDGVRDIIRQDIKNEVKSYTPKPRPQPEPDADLTLKQKFEKVFKEWDEIVPGQLTTKDKLLMTDDLWFRGLRARLNQLFNSAFKDEEESIRRIAELSQQAFKEMDNAEVRKTLFKTIDIEIENLRKTENFTKEKAFEILRTELNKKVPGKAYQLVESLKKNQSLHGYQSYWRHLLDETYVGKIFSMPRYKEGPNAGKINWGATVGNLVHRTLMTLTTGNPRKYTEVLEEFVYAYGKSAWKGFGIYLLWLHGVKRIVFPIIFGFVDTLYYGWKNETGKEDHGDFFGTYGFFIKERIKDTFLEYNKSFEQNLKMNKYEISIFKSIISTINPFSWFWDDIKNFADWHTEGGARRAWGRFVKHSRESVESSEELRRARALYDSARVRVDSAAAKAERIEQDMENLTGNSTDDQVKELLYQHLQKMDRFIDKNNQTLIADEDKNYIKKIGDNTWEFELTDGSKLNFNYNPQTKTFTEK